MNIKKKDIGYLALGISVFSAVVVTMASTGKIDVADVPVVNKVVSVVSPVVNYGGISKENSTNIVENENTEKPSYDYSQIIMPEGDFEEAYGADMYTMATLAVPVSNYTSISDVKTDTSGNIYVADFTGHKVYKVSASGEVFNLYTSNAQVNGVCVNNGKVYSLEGALDGNVVVLDSNLNKITTIPVGHTPTDMVVNGSTAYVANRYTNTISVIDIDGNKVTKTISIEGREPNALAIANGKLYVACHLPDEGAKVEDNIISSNVVVINLSTNTVVKELDLINGADGVKGICASPDGGTIYVSHIIARYTYPTTQLDRGWINTNGISIINTSNDTVTTSVMIDEVELGAANPWGITTSKDGSKLICALSGVDEVMIIDINAMNNKINNVRNGNGVVDSMEDIPNYLPFLDGCRTRIPLSGKGARSVWADSGKVYIGLYFEGSIDVLNLTNNSISNIKFVTQPENDDARKGEILFSDATMCYQKWQSCLSCHPDARVDGLNWDNMNDGLGNPKSAKSMLYSHRTPPVMSTGIRASAEIAVRAGMKFIQFNALEEVQMGYIDEYLKTLMPVSSPFLNRDGTLSESALRGKDIYNTVGCATCHPAPLYTDLKTHSVNATKNTDSWENREMDTPTLIEVWRTGPWIFDGRFNTMEEAVRHYAQGKNLTDNQIKDLTNYVLSIGNEGELYGVEQVIVNVDNNTYINTLKPSGYIDYISIRRQDGNVSKNANVTAVLEANGNVLNTVTKNVTNTEYNKAIKIELGIDIPSDIEPGAKLTIKIEDENGKKLASDYLIVY